MVAGDPALAAAFEHGMDGDQLVVLQNADLVGQRVHLDDAAAGAIGNRIKIAADRHHTLASDPAIERQHDGEGHGRRRLQVRLFLGEMLQHDAGGGMPARVGNRIEPELRIQIVEVAERAAEEEVFPDVAERALHFALGFLLCRADKPSAL